MASGLNFSVLDGAAKEEQSEAGYGKPFVMGEWFDGQQESVANGRRRACGPRVNRDCHDYASGERLRYIHAKDALRVLQEDGVPRWRAGDGYTSQGPIGQSFRYCIGHRRRSRRYRLCAIL